MSDEQVSETIDDIREFAHIVEPKQKLMVINRDPDDNKFLECSLEGGAEYIVSGDKDLLDLKTYQGIYILSPAAFLAILSSDRT